jgi:hypothetical protein
MIDAEFRERERERERESESARERKGGSRLGGRADKIRKVGAHVPDAVVRRLRKTERMCKYVSEYI